VEPVDKLKLIKANILFFWMLYYYKLREFISFVRKVDIRMNH